MWRCECGVYVTNSSLAVTISIVTAHLVKLLQMMLDSLIQTFLLFVPSKGLLNSTNCPVQSLMCSSAFIILEKQAYLAQ